MAPSTTNVANSVHAAVAIVVCHPQNTGRNSVMPRAHGSLVALMKLMWRNITSSLRVTVHHQSQSHHPVDLH